MNYLANPALWFVVCLLTVLGVAFSYMKYEFGKEGWEVILKKHPHFEQERIDKITGLYGAHGSIILLLSAIPGVDTLVTVAAGAVGIKRMPFVIWVTIAKLARFSLLAILFVAISSPLRG